MEFSMIFDGHHGTDANLLIPTQECQDNITVAVGNNGNSKWPFLSTPYISLQKQDTVSYVPWSHKAHDNPYDLINCVQSIISRKPTDNTDHNGDTDPPVTHIVDGVDSNNNFTDGSLPKCIPFWSPKTQREQLPQYSQSEAKSQHDPLNLPDGGGEVQHALKLPPGLPMPKEGNTYMSQIKQSTSDSTSADKDGGKQSVSNSSQSKINSPYFDPHYKDNYIPSSAKSRSDEQYVPQDIDQLVSNLHYFMSVERDSFCRGDFSNMPKQTLGMLHKDSMPEQWETNSSKVSTQSALAMQTRKQLLGEFGMVPRERDGGMMKNTFNCGAPRDHMLEECQSELLSDPVNLQNQYQNKLITHGENINMVQCVEPRILHGQMQNRIKQEMQNGKRMQMPGLLGEGLSTRPLSNTYMNDGDQTQAFSHRPLSQPHGGMATQRFDRENGEIDAETTAQRMPLWYPVIDLRPHPGIAPNSKFSFTSTLPSGSGFSCTDVYDRSASESFNMYSSETRTCSGGGTIHGDGPVVPLFVLLDECYEQWRCLEKERKRAEVLLTKAFVGKRIAAETNNVLPKTPPNPTRVDHLIVKQMREQAKVASLLTKMEALLDIPLQSNIHNALNKNHVAICLTQAKHKEELAMVSKQQEQRAHMIECRDILWAVALKDLAASTKMLRTALWCALQKTLPTPDETQVKELATRREECISPCDGYSFK